MNLFQKITSSFIGILMTFAAAVPSGTQRQGHLPHLKNSVNVQEKLHDSVGGMNSTTYLEYYYGSSSTRGTRVIFSELYINLNNPISWAWKNAGISKSAALSMTEVYEKSKDESSLYYGAYTPADGSSTDIYQQLKTMISGKTDSSGYAPVTEEMIPLLNQIALNIGTNNKYTGDMYDNWDTFCFYKGRKNSSANPYASDEKVHDVRLVYGNDELSDEDAFTLLIMGDGFDSSDQDKFYENAAALAEYMMETKPYNEFTDMVKIYALGVDSNDSGISNDVESIDDYGKKLKDTYFQTSFWCWSGTSRMQRLVSISKLGLLKINSLIRYELPYADFAGLLANSTRYGGAGGTYCTCSLCPATDENYQTDAREIFIHEIAHTIADLADEYLAGDEYFGSHPNMSNAKKRTGLPWYDWIGVDGVDRYAYVDMYDEVVYYNGTAWYKPCSGTCKMEMLGKNHPFCPVCAEALRVNICKNSNVTHISYKQYNRTFEKYDGGVYTLANGKIINSSSEINPLSYVYLTKGDDQSALDVLNSDLITVTIKDGEGNSVSALNNVGTYTVTVSYDGDDEFEQASITVEMTIREYVPEEEDEPTSGDTPASNDSGETHGDIPEKEKKSYLGLIVTSSVAGGIIGITGLVFLFRYLFIYKFRRKLKKRL